VSNNIHEDLFCCLHRFFTAKAYARCVTPGYVISLEHTNKNTSLKAGAQSSLQIAGG